MSGSVGESWGGQLRRMNAAVEEVAVSDVTVKEEKLSLPLKIKVDVI